MDSSGGSLDRLLINIMILLLGISLLLCSIAFAYLVSMGRGSENARKSLVATYTPRSDRDIVKVCSTP